jgi:hypothetical protein
MATFFAGKEAAVAVGAVTYYGDKWEFNDETDEIEVTNFESPVVGGVSRGEFLGGFTKGNVTVEGFHDPTLARPTNGGTTTYVLTIGSTYTISGSAIVKTTRFFTDVKGAARFAFTLRPTGTVTFT